MSSVMERLRFLGLYRFRSDDFPPEYNYSHPIASDTVGTKKYYNSSRSEPVARKPTSKTGGGEGGQGEGGDQEGGHSRENCFCPSIKKTSLVNLGG
ncbi:hypothetical protein ZWY2020_004470 [Hordeum vulgare]|nr:hypothetical protein ZWY2020_004470 [Hordeum vulgare]